LADFGVDAESASHTQINQLSGGMKAGFPGTSHFLGQLKTQPLFHGVRELLSFTSHLGVSKNR